MGRCFGQCGCRTRPKGQGRQGSDGVYAIAYCTVAGGGWGCRGSSEAKGLSWVLLGVGIACITDRRVVQRLQRFLYMSHGRAPHNGRLQREIPTTVVISTPNAPNTSNGRASRYRPVHPRADPLNSTAAVIAARFPFTDGLHQTSLCFGSRSTRPRGSSRSSVVGCCADPQTRIPAVRQPCLERLRVAR